MSVLRAGEVVRTADVAQPAWTYSRADADSDRGGASLTVAVAQISSVAGAGLPAVAPLG